MAISPITLGSGDIPTSGGGMTPEKFTKSFFNIMKSFNSMLGDSMDLNLSGDPSQGMVKDDEEEE